MMTDLIRRQDAIDAINELHDKRNAWLDLAVEALEKLPSSQPKQPTEIKDILTYLDEELHPIVAPNNWNVYSELHDMISELSVEPERKKGEDGR